MERIIVGALYSEMPLGLYVVRGENVVLLGEIDESRDPPPALQRARCPAVYGLLRVDDSLLACLAVVHSPRRCTVVCGTYAYWCQAAGQHSSALLRVFGILWGMF